MMTIKSAQYQLMNSNEDMDSEYNAVVRGYMKALDIHKAESDANVNVNPTPFINTITECLSLIARRNLSRAEVDSFFEEHGHFNSEEISEIVACQFESYLEWASYSNWNNIESTLVEADLCFAEHEEEWDDDGNLYVIVRNSPQLNLFAFAENRFADGEWVHDITRKIDASESDPDEVSREVGLEFYFTFNDINDRINELGGESCKR